MKVIATQDEDTWFEDFLRDALRDEPSSAPPKEQHIGKTTVRWHECDPGVAFIVASGGTPDDKFLAETIVREQLRGHGFKRASYSLEWDLNDRQIVKEATWEDIEAKAKRLLQSGAVQLLRNGYNVVVSHVKGDHGDYQSEFNRDDPESQAITMWHCDCPWDQFAWQRTRQWKKYEGRVCSHVLATYWLSKMTPLDEDAEPSGTPLAPSGGGGEAGSIGPQVPTGQGPRVFGPEEGQSNIAPVPPGGAGIIPPFPMAQQPQVNPASVPGQKPQTPTNPVQNEGGTFSSVQPDNLRRMAEQQFTNGMMVVNKNDEIGQWVGLGSGGSVSIPKNSRGEVLGVDPTTGMVNVYFAGPAASNGPLEPHGATAWFFPSELVIRSDIKPPGPAITRR